MSIRELQSWLNSHTILLVIIFFLGGHILLSQLGLVPSEVSEFNQQAIGAVANLHTLSYERQSQTPVLPRSSLSANQEATAVGAIPEHIYIDKINVDAPISSPNETSISALDSALEEGVVHYPGSGGVDGSRRMFLFGHSSRLPVVQNEAFRSFNGLDELEAGDEIVITADEKRQVYRVTSVEVVDKDEKLVSFEQGEGRLTLSTCTTFGTRENRVVVEAELYSTTMIEG